MTHKIRVIAHPLNPVDMNRLVRLLIAQAQLEQNKQRATEASAAARLDEDAAS